MTRIIHYTQKQFELAPEGVHPARLGEIKDIDPALNPKGEEKERIRFVWGLKDMRNSHGDPMPVYQTFNLSLHPQSFLTRAIVDISGKEPGTQFDLDTLLGIECDLVLRHAAGNDGRTYCNVAAILRHKTPAEDAEEKRVTEAVAGVKRRAAQSHVVEHAPSSDASATTDEDIPF